MDNREVTIIYSQPSPTLIGEFTRVVIKDAFFRDDLKKAINDSDVDELNYVQMLRADTILIDVSFEEFPNKFVAFVKKYKLEETCGVTIQLIAGDD